jgi:hypothetical protein
MFDSSIRSVLLSCSTALSEQTHLPLERMWLGFRPLHWHRSGQLERALGAFGLRRDDNLWVRGDGPSRFEYEHRLDENPSSLGYLTLGELDAWARELCERAAVSIVPIELAPLTQLMHADAPPFDCSSTRCSRPVRGSSCGSLPTPTHARTQPSAWRSGSSPKEPSFGSSPRA